MSIISLLLLKLFSFINLEKYKNILFILVPLISMVVLILDYFYIKLIRIDILNHTSNIFIIYFTCWFIVIVKNILYFKENKKIKIEWGPLVLIHIPIINNIYISTILSSLAFIYSFDFKNKSIKFNNPIFFIMLYTWLSINWFGINIYNLIYIIEGFIIFALLKEYVKFVNLKNSSYYLALLTILTSHNLQTGNNATVYLVLNVIFLGVWSLEYFDDLNYIIKKIKNNYYLKNIITKINIYNSSNLTINNYSMNKQKIVINDKKPYELVNYENDLRMNLITVFFLILILTYLVLFGAEI